MGSAFIKGLEFTPEAPYSSGLIIPVVFVVLSNITIYGLLIVGDTVIDPFGDDLEDFAVLHFVEFTAKASFESMYCDNFKPSKGYLENWKPKERRASEMTQGRRFSLRSAPPPPSGLQDSLTA